MNAAIVGASVAAKWVLNEENSDKAGLLLMGATLHAPAHWLAESVNVLWARVSRSLLHPAQALERAKLLATAPVVSVALDGLVADAMSHALAYKITIHDSLYVALAQRRGVPLVTADRKLLLRLKDSSLAPDLLVWVGDLG